MKRKWILAALMAAGAAFNLGGCARYDYTGSLGIQPATGTLTNTGEALAALPDAPAAPLNVAVYDFQDLTGQNKSSFKVGFPEFSRAITQGASVILVDALKTAGNGGWFNVVERGYLDSLLRERRLIQDTYAFLKRDPKNLIDPLKFAEYIVTGGVVSYDSPISTVSANALFAGYGGGLNASKDLVTINLRLVRVRDGVVMTTINASRPIVSAGANASVTRVIGSRILDAQVGAGLQEAVQTAVREAIEAGVYELVREGNDRGFWMRKIVPSPTPASNKGPMAQRSRKTNTADADVGRPSRQGNIASGPDDIDDQPAKKPGRTGNATDPHAREEPYSQTSTLEVRPTVAASSSSVIVATPAQDRGELVRDNRPEQMKSASALVFSGTAVSLMAMAK